MALRFLHTSRKILVLRHSGKRTVFYWSLNVTALSTVLLAAFFGWTLQLDTTSEESPWRWLGKTVPYIQGLAPFWIPVLTLTGAGTGVVAKWMGKPWMWQAIDEQLNEFRNLVFPDKPDDPIYHHRVTLFKKLGWFRRVHMPRFWFIRDPLLVPVARSGHMTQHCTVAFRVSHKGRRAEGVAGMAWERRGTCTVSNLPEIKDEFSTKEIEQYIRETHVPRKWVTRRLKENKPFARSMCGITVVAGGVWGVIMIDSIEPDAIDGESEDKYELFGRSLSTMLKKV